MKKPTTISKESVSEYREFVQLRLRKRVVPSIYSSASPWVGSQPCGAKYPGFCADSKGV